MDREMDRRKDRRTDNVKPVYPPLNFVEAGSIITIIPTDNDFVKALISDLFNLSKPDESFMHQGTQSSSEFPLACLPSGYKPILK